MMNYYDHCLLKLYGIFALLLICTHSMSKMNQKIEPLAVKSGKILSGEWTDRDINFFDDAQVSDTAILGSINRDVTIKLAKNVTVKGLTKDSLLRFVIAPGRKIIIQSNNNHDANFIFDNLKVSFPDLTVDDRQLILKNVIVGGTEAAEISAPNIASVSMILQENQKKFIPVK